VRDVVVFGTGDYGRIARRYLERDGGCTVRAFTVHGTYRDRDELEGVPVLPFEELADRHPPGTVDVLVAAGFSKVNAVRAAIFEECRSAGYGFVTYVSSQAFVWPDVPIGENSFVFEANVVQPGVTIGRNTVLWSGNHVGHDSTIGDHCFIASHAVISGNCTIGDSCFIGVNATLRDGVTVAPRCVIGAGAIVLRDTAEGDVLRTEATKPHRLKSWELRGF
jgi:sugar O-acyltransferase (sialic acid O-acetyltransferase NeuD family)